MILIILLALAPFSISFAQLPGDFNCNGRVNSVDLTYLVNQLRSGLIDTGSCTWHNGDLNSDGLFHTIADWQQFCIFFYPNPPCDNPPLPNELDSIIIADAWAIPGDTVWLPIRIFAADSLRAFMIQLQFDQLLLLEPAIRSQINPDGYISQLRNGEEYYCYYFNMTPVIFAPGMNHVGDIGFIVSDSAPLDTTLELELIGGDYYPSGLANNSYPTYFIRPILVNGHIHIGTSEIGGSPIPNAYQFKFANYPNPFNSSTSIELSLTQDSDIKIDIFDILGRKVMRLFEGHLQAGYHHFTWDAANFSSGIYFARMNDGQHSKSIKLTLLR